MIPFSHIDTLFADELLGSQNSEAHTLLAHLMKVSREGSLALFAPQAKKLLENLLSLPHSPIVAYKDFIYLRKNWDLESNVIIHLKRLLEEKGKLPKLSPPKASLYQNQQKAYETFQSHPLLILSGGPGCGKTFLAKEIIEGLFDVKKDAHIIFTAPTAKAASRLFHPKVISKTLHSLLGLKETIDLTKMLKPVTADLIIVDECSMIDIKLWSLLLSSINTNAHIILMGDPHQLPPVETVGIFSDLCMIPEIPHIHLNEVKRTRSTTLQNLNRFIKEGDFDQTLSLLENPLSPDAALLPLPKDIAPLLSLSSDAIILTPFNKGPFGTESINAAIDKVYPHRKKPIIITKNDYRLGLMNGERGFIENGMATFQQNGKEITYPVYLLSSYELAFAISIHKSQGSEFEHVYLLLPEGSEVFCREMLYTGVTRARSSLTLFTDNETLKKTLLASRENHTHLKSRL